MEKFVDIKTEKKICVGKQYEIGVTTVVFNNLETDDLIVRMAYSHKDIKESPLYIPLEKRDDGYAQWYSVNDTN